METDKPVLPENLKTLTEKSPIVMEILIKIDYNPKITVTEGKTPTIISLATGAALNAVENSVSKVSDLLKKTDYESKISNIETKYFTITDYNNIMGEIFHVKMKAKGLLINLIFWFNR